MLAVAIALFVGRTAEQPTLPNAILDYQEAITRDAAQSVRRGVNEGVDDLEQFALTLEARDAPAAFPADVDLPALLGGVATTHGRYQALYLLRGSGRVIARVGGTPLAALLDPPPPYREPGMHDARRTSGRGVPLLQQYAPIRSGRSDDRLTVVGHYDTRFMSFALEVAQPGDAWVVNRRGQVIGALNLFDDEPGPLSDRDAVVAQALADVATIAILQHRTALEAQVVTNQLSRALDSRVVIEQAKGMIAAKGHLPLDQAFARLRSYARSRSARLADVARAVVDGTLDLAATGTVPD